jgi:hypothetical protein
MTDRFIIFISGVATIVGILLWRAGTKVLRNSKRSIATVIQNRREKGSWAGDNDIYYRIISFYTDKNERITQELKAGSEYETPLGSTIEVIYNPKNPHDFDTHPSFYLKTLPRILVGAGLTGLTIATLEVLEIISIIPNWIE